MSKEKHNTLNEEKNIPLKRGPRFTGVIFQSWNIIKIISILGDDEELFEIHQETGSVIIKKSLDRETFVGFDLRIKAYEVVNPSSFATILLKISLIDENDNRPYFEQRFYLVRIMEDSIFANTIISTNIRAVDDDVTVRNLHENTSFFELLRIFITV